MTTINKHLLIFINSQFLAKKVDGRVIDGF